MPVGDLTLLGVPERAVGIIDALTRRPAETEDEQVHRVMETPGAVRTLTMKGRDGARLIPSCHRPA